MKQNKLSTFQVIPRSCFSQSALRMVVEIETILQYFIDYIFGFVYETSRNNVIMFS